MKEYNTEIVANIRCLVGKANSDYIDITDDEWNAVEMAIKAIHKQIALKPLLYKLYYRCPVCGLVLLFDDEIPRTDGREGAGPAIDNYCSVCGQKIDWEGVNDERFD